MRRPGLFLLLLLLMASLWAPGVVQAQVKRCTAADGSLVYTDRKCATTSAPANALAPCR